MPLNPATRLGTYEIVGPLGAGGMGEVYRAKDLRLGVTSRSRCCPKPLPSMPTTWPASSVKHAPWRA
jgi:serine/threonine protein kinase